MFERGREITLAYPQSTHVLRVASAPRRERNLIVHSVRDLVESPLTPSEFLRRPYVARSRWLVKCWDQELQEFRQFYPGSTREFAAPGTLRLALYQPGEARPREFIGHQFEPSVIDRREMVRLVVRWMADRERDRREGLDEHAATELRIVASDMRLIA
ncbi:MAG: hypothetical protein ACF788_01235 [Novipirellula sp. JB048]